LYRRGMPRLYNGFMLAIASISAAGNQLRPQFEAVNSCSNLEPVAHAPFDIPEQPDVE
jgi:hypothetical protein